MIWAYLLINILHRSTTRSLGSREASTPATALDTFFFISSKVSWLSSITRPVKDGLYSLHSRTDFIIDMHWIKNSSNDNTSGSGFVILFKQKSTTGQRTLWSPNEYGCLCWIAISIFIDLVHAFFKKSQNLECFSWKAESALIMNQKMFITPHAHRPGSWTEKTKNCYSFKST